MKNNYNKNGVMTVVMTESTGGPNDIHGVDRTTRGNRSFNPNMAEADTVSNTSEKKKKIIVRIVTVFSVIFFLMCFAMIAFTLRMSDKIDAESKTIFKILFFSL
jgi:hypothetical protein